MSIRVRGTITIQRKTSSRGAFNVGDLVTEIGEFEVKDSLIEEFEPGKYSGDFLIKFIAPDSYSWRGRVFVKVRATLDGTSEGRRMAREQVQSMARAADLAASAVALLNRMLEQQRTTHPEVARDIERLLQRAGLLRSVSIVDSTSSEG
jgi:hypothetical protein